MPTLEIPSMELMSLRDITELLKISSASLDRIRHDDPAFPRAIMVRPRRPRWERSAIEEWLRSRHSN